MHRIIAWLKPDTDRSVLRAKQAELTNKAVGAGAIRVSSEWTALIVTFLESNEKTAEFVKAALRDDLVERINTEVIE